jgi:hypothetical protein
LFLFAASGEAIHERIAATDLHQRKHWPPPADQLGEYVEASSNPIGCPAVQENRSPKWEEDLRKRIGDQENREDQLAEKEEPVRGTSTNTSRRCLRGVTIDGRKHASQTHLESSPPRHRQGLGLDPSTNLFTIVSVLPLKYMSIGGWNRSGARLSFAPFAGAAKAEKNRGRRGGR